MVVSLEGRLGVGKTTLVKGIALALGIEEPVTSPSFTIMSVYKAPVCLYHIDLYRIESNAEIEGAGLEDVLFENRDGVAVVEWGERAAEMLPDEAIRVRIDFTEEKSAESESVRSICINGIEMSSEEPEESH
jgi:tRNA threonylcarbamoyladenosine biosynthesis protein TsaE